LMFEVEQVLMKAMQLDHKGNVKEYSEFLESSIQKYCVTTLDANGYHLSQTGNENFHLNLRTLIQFVAEGKKLDAHTMLALSPSGFIIDPTDKELNPFNDAQPCPLLSGLFEMGAPTKNEEQTADKSEDSPHAFDHRVLDYHVDEYYDLVKRSLLRGDCLDIAMEMPKEILRNFLLNWVDMVQQSAMNTEKASDDHQVLQIRSEEYVIERDTGDILEVAEFNEKEQWRCSGIQPSLNAPWSFDDDPQQEFTVDTVREHVAARFDEWFHNDVHKSVVAHSHIEEAQAAQRLMNEMSELADHI